MGFTDSTASVRSVFVRAGRVPVAVTAAAALTLTLGAFTAEDANAAGGTGTRTAAAATPACTGAEVKPSIVHGTDADPDPHAGQTSAVLLLTNTGKRTCTVKGHMGVDLIAANKDRWSLARQKKVSERITLRPGTATMAELTFLPWNAEEQEGSGAEEFKPVKVAMTPPNTTTTTTVSWPWPSLGLIRQDGATHPGTWVSPLEGTATS
ncbi:DUF4232 domain-containing protein [Streptomyces sp. NPDC088729]|uniref:DUF4232 domain-containing protein n=1 Tax=Streptomyces sp. NPDC088729 TaxID=3365876 RepID=UPI0038000FC8